MVEGLKYYLDAKPEQKLQVVRSEVSNRTPTIRGYATLIRQWVESEKGTEDIPEHIREGIAQIIEASIEIEEIVNLLTDRS